MNAIFQLIERLHRYCRSRLEAGRRGWVRPGSVRPGWARTDVEETPPLREQRLWRDLAA